jgi:outer membrane protein assembly factor BamB
VKHLGGFLPFIILLAGCEQAPPSPSNTTNSAESAENIPTDSNHSANQAESLHFWPQWRGPLATGEAPHANPPLDWNESKNVRWKVPLPYQGHSSPIIWEERIFLTGTIAEGDPLPVPEQPPGAHNNVDPKRALRFMVACIDLKDGSLVWEKTVRYAQPHQSTHESSNWASASPVTDGERIFAFFGSNGLYALDLNGSLLWEKDLGDMQVKHGHGEGTSPALFGNTLVVNWDHEGDSFVVALDKKTGDERWRKPRDEPTSWASPVIARVDGKPQVIVSGTTAVRGYDLETGEVIWHCSGLSNNVVASPVFADGILYAGSSYEIQSMLALNLKGAKGDLRKSTHELWTRQHRTPYVPSPLFYKEHLYFLRHYQAILTRVVGKTGEEPNGPIRLPGILNLYASPVAAGGRIYFTDQQGFTLVISWDKAPEILSLNRLDDTFNASAALVGDSIILRGEKFLYRLTTAE